MLVKQKGGYSIEATPLHTQTPASCLLTLTMAPEMIPDRYRWCDMMELDAFEQETLEAPSVWAYYGMEEPRYLEEHLPWPNVVDPAALQDIWYPYFVGEALPCGFDGPWLSTAVCAAPAEPGSYYKAKSREHSATHFLRNDRPRSAPHSTRFNDTIIFVSGAEAFELGNYALSFLRHASAIITDVRRNDCCITTHIATFVLELRIYRYTETLLQIVWERIAGDPASAQCVFRGLAEYLQDCCCVRMGARI